MNCHLLVPDLFWLPSAGNDPYRGLELPALETLLARGRRTRIPGASLERALAQQFDLAEELPLAPYSLRGDGGEPGANWWMRADPVHLVIHGNRLMLADASRLAVTPDEARQCVAALNAHFANDGILFVAPRPERWYFRAAQEIRVRTTPTSEAAGRNVEASLPEGDDSARWRRLINEAQMVLHQQPCNETRESEARPTVNSIWIWGAGRDRTLPTVHHTIWSDHPLAAGLAAASGALARSLPVSGATLLTGRAAGSHLVVLAFPAAAYGEQAEWREAVMMLERSWAAPLLAALLEGTLETLTLQGLGTHHGHQSVMTRRDRLSFWRVRRPLRAYAA
jgi:hypothetical protein